MTRVLIPARAWPRDRFPGWAVAALRAAGARVDDGTGSRLRPADLALLPAASRATAPHVHARRIVALLDAPLRAGDLRLRGTVVVATSAALAAAWDGPVRVVRPAVPASERPPSGAARGAQALRVASVAPLHWSAGHEYAVAAVAALVAGGTPVRLHVAGEGPAREAVLFAAFDLGIDGAVTVDGTAERAAVETADIVVVPAVEDRAWTALLHAFACEVPAVASDLPTARELGPFVPVRPREPASLAAALAGLAGDPALRADLAAQGRRAAVTDLAACGHALLEAAR